MEKLDLTEVARNFEQIDQIFSVTRFGNGLINDTFLVSCPEKIIVMQRINNHVFPEPEKIMSNLFVLQQFLSGVVPEDKHLKIPGIIKTKRGELFYRDGYQNIWRALDYISPSITLEHIGDDKDAKRIGSALGHFHWLFRHLAADRLFDTLPGFHIAPDYLRRYHQALDKFSEPSVHAEFNQCRAFIERHYALTESLEQAKEKGLLGIRIIHGDPKLNNFLFDPKTRDILSLIDLDTVKPGLLHYDIGDCVRSICQNPETGEFELKIFASFLAGYLPQTKDFFSDEDFRYLLPAIQLIPFELGLRFFTDYLDGNRYFKVNDLMQNLDRAAEQFRLCQSILDQSKQIEVLIAEYRNC